jgi:hypothetical protein
MWIWMKLKFNIYTANVTIFSPILRPSNVSFTIKSPVVLNYVFVFFFESLQVLRCDSYFALLKKV